MLLAAPVALLITTVSMPAATGEELIKLNMPEMASSDVFSGQRSRETLIAQVLLDRTQFSPGVIDGLPGGNTRRAISAYQRAHGMAENGDVSKELLRKLAGSDPTPVFEIYEITKADVNGPFVDVPSGFSEMAKLEKLAYENARELLAEKFHMDEEFLRALNPDADFSKVGAKIVVVAVAEPNPIAGVARIEVHKQDNSVWVYDTNEKIIARYPATVGSNDFPSPTGEMEVIAVAPEPKYYFEPDGRKWGPNESLQIAAGPNNPVGGTWIDLAKEGYGIHGTPDPQLIGKTASHGCVRLTNWDVQRLGKAVQQGVKVKFI